MFFYALHISLSRFGVAVVLEHDGRQSLCEHRHGLRLFLQQGCEIVRCRLGLSLWRSVEYGVGIEIFEG